MLPPIPSGRVVSVHVVNFSLTSRLVITLFQSKYLLELSIGPIGELVVCQSMADVVPLFMVPDLLLNFVEVAQPHLKFFHRVIHFVILANIVHKSLDVVLLANRYFYLAKGYFHQAQGHEGKLLHIY